ncbi:MAG TPA: heme-binding protein [Galbitalea sp.]|nr:heme-binding protein [Galbitalea sp.]
MNVCNEIVAAAMENATSIGARVSIAVVDAGGNLLSFTRMDGAEIAGPTLAVDKAYTAVSNRITTEELATLAAPGGPLFGIHSNGGGRFVIFGGGVPIFVDGEVVGGIGVSGGAVEEDIASATAGLARYEELRAK